MWKRVAGKMGIPEWAAWLDRTADLDGAMEGTRQDVSISGHLFKTRICLLKAAITAANRSLFCAFENACDGTVSAKEALMILASHREIAILSGRQSGGFEPTVVEGRPEELCGILKLHRALDAAQHMVDGQPEESVKVLREMLASSPRESPESVAFWLISLAVALVELGDEEEARQVLDAAGIAVRHSERLLYQARGAARLEACYRAMGDELSAMDWRAYLVHIECPDATVRYVRARARLLGRFTRTGAPIL